MRWHENKQAQGTKPPFDFAAMAAKAKGMSSAELLHALRDIQDTIKTFGPGHPNEGWYQDEASVYHDELRRRRSLEKTPTTAQSHTRAANPRTHMYEYYVEHARDDLAAALSSYQSSQGEHLMTWDLLRAIDKIKLAYQIAEEHDKTTPKKDPDEARLAEEGQEDKRLHEGVPQ